jgi:hypothetical protein
MFFIKIHFCGCNTHHQLGYMKCKPEFVLWSISLNWFMGCSSYTATEHGGTIILRNVGNYLPNNTTLTPQKTWMSTNAVVTKLQSRTTHVHQVILPALDILWTYKATKWAQCITAYVTTANCLPRCAQEPETEFERSYKFAISVNILQRPVCLPAPSGFCRPLATHFLYF